MGEADHAAQRLTFHNVDHAQTQQTGDQIGCCRVDGNGPSHAVSNQHDGGSEVSVHGLHHISNVPANEEAGSSLQQLSTSPNSALQFSAFEVFC